MSRQGSGPTHDGRGTIAAIYGLDELRWHLTRLGDQVATMKTWEQLFKQVEEEAKINPTGAALDMLAAWISSKFDDEKAKILGSSQLAQLDNIPERLAAIVGIPFQPFVQTAGSLGAVGLKFTDMSSDPGQILSRVIGLWQGSAAEEFEDYFLTYESAQLRQAELFANFVNGCTSIGESLVEFQKSVKSLVEAAWQVANQINSDYEAELKRRGDAVVAAAVIVVTTVITGGVATGAAAGAAFAAGSVSLAYNVIVASAEAREFKATDSETFLESLSDLVSVLESSLDLVDSEVYSAVDAVRSEWSLNDSTIPRPPGSADCNEESFRHESA